MATVDLTSAKLWTTITQMLDADDEHVCVLPMTTLIQPVRSITVLQVDAKVNAARSKCPPGSKDLPIETTPEQPPGVQTAPPKVPAQPQPLPPPGPQIVDEQTIATLVSDRSFFAQLREVYSRSRDPKLGKKGILFGNILTVDIDWNTYSALPGIIQIDIETGELVGHQQGSVPKYIDLVHVGGTKYAFAGPRWNFLQEGDLFQDDIDVADFDAPRVLYPYCVDYIVDDWDPLRTQLAQAYDLDKNKLSSNPARNTPGILYRNTLTLVFGSRWSHTNIVAQLDVLQQTFIGHEPLEVGRISGVEHAEGTTFKYSGSTGFNNIDVANFP